MCGIAGFYNFRTKLQIQEENLYRVLESMRYRGPDHLGIYKDVDIAIGNVRLAIQDLSEEGNQPIYNEDKSIVVVYNGEIYNFRELKTQLQKKGHIFYTKTDTEVLVHLYEEFGEEMVKDLNGMFAFALFDKKNRLLLLGRDRTAQKPLYINRNKNGIFFSSELKSMLPFLENRTLNPSSIRTFLCMGYFLEPQTILEDVETIEPDSVCMFNYSGEKVKRFKSIRTKSSNDINNLDEWKEKADFTLRRAVKRHLISDVPITLLLSGGIDSSLLSLYLKEENKIKKAFVGSFIDRKDHDEYDAAAEMGKYCGFEVERVQLSNSSLAINVEGFLSNLSMPLGDYSALATYCMSREISAEYRVVLGGDGGDELFAGYPTYILPYLAKKYSFIPKSLINLGHYITSFTHDRGKYMSLPFKLQQLSLAWREDPLNAHFLLKNFLPDMLAQEILEKPFIPSLDGNRAERVLANHYNDSILSDPARKLSWVDFNTFLMSATIPKVERNTMLFSVETRLPYLDNEMLDLSINTNTSLMLAKTETKYCLKSLLKDKVAGKVNLNLKKQGFSPPLSDMLKNELLEWKKDRLNSKTPFFKPGLSNVLSKWQLKRWDFHRLEWNICILNDWCIRNKIV
jgi:asparagine synthase (glutamine-hydrolysing)